MTAKRRRRTRRRSAGPRPRLAAGMEEPSGASTTRLSLYLRLLQQCEASGRALIASNDLAKASGVKPALVRKDLSQFGPFGIRGVGYEVSTVRTEITRVLGLDRDHPVVILGAGNLGMALADARGFNGGGFKVLALFDSDRDKVGTASRNGVPVLATRDLAAFARSHSVAIAALAVPEASGQRALDQAARAGIRAVLNFVPGYLVPPRGMVIRSVDLRIQLESLSSLLARASSRSRPRGS